MGNLYLVTGPSGTGLSESLGKYCRASGARLVKLEDHLVEVAKPYLDGSPARPSMREVVALPPPILQELWPHACELAMTAGSAAGEPVQKLLQGSDVFLTFHAVWYHLGTTAFVPAVDIDTLRRQVRVAGQPKSVITLIDDAYDTLTRLMRPREVFENELLEWDNPVTAISSMLLTILGWRESEARHAEGIARGLAANVPHVLFAVKHPLRTFQTLVTCPSPRRVYFSHPISEPRRRGIERDGDGESMMEFIARSAASLRAAKNIVLIEPTTIDEMRLRNAQEALPELRQRWTLPLEKDGAPADLLWDGLITPGDAARTASDQELALQPFLTACNRVPRLSTESDPAVSPDGRHPMRTVELIRVLDAEIEHQLNWRDRQLVSESQGIVVVRPFSKQQGSHSRSVGREMETYLALRSFEMEREQSPPKRIPAVVYHPRHDERNRRVTACMTTLNDRAGNGSGRIRNWNDVAAAAIEAQLQAADLDDWATWPSEQVGAAFVDLFNRLDVAAKPALNVAKGTALESGTSKSDAPRIERELGSTLRDALVGTSVPAHPTHALTIFSDPEHAQTIAEDFGRAEDLGRALGQRITTLFDQALEEPSGLS
jgi:hypothetical protein